MSEDADDAEVAADTARVLFESPEGSMILVGAGTITLDLNKMIAYDDALASGPVTVPITAVLIRPGLMQVSVREDG